MNTAKTIKERKVIVNHYDDLFVSSKTKTVALKAVKLFNKN